MRSFDTPVNNKQKLQLLLLSSPFSAYIVAIVKVIRICCLVDSAFRNLIVTWVDFVEHILYGECKAQGFGVIFWRGIGTALSESFHYWVKV